MSKRRSRKSSANLPAETLARARREAGLEPEAAEEAEPIEAVEESAPVMAVPRRAEALPPAQRRKRRRDKDVDVSELTQAEIAQRLANPTRTVSEDELRAQYAYVLADLRGMGLLAAALFALMIVVAQFLGR